MLCSLEADQSRYVLLVRMAPNQLAAKIPSMSTEDLQAARDMAISEIGQFQATLPAVTDPGGQATLTALLGAEQANLAQINAELQNRQGPEGPSIFEPSSGPDTASSDYLNAQLGDLFSSIGRNFKKAAAVAFPVVSLPAFLATTARQRQGLFGLTSTEARNAEVLAKVGRAAAGTIAVATVAGPASPAVISAGGAVISGQVANAGSRKGNPVAQGQAVSQAFTQTAPGVIKGIKQASPTPVAPQSFFSGPTSAPAATSLSSEADGDFTESNWMGQAGVPVEWQRTLIIAPDSHWIGRTMDKAFLIKKENGHVTVAIFDIQQLPEAKVLPVGTMQSAPPSIGDAVGMTRPVSKAQSVSLGAVTASGDGAWMLAAVIAVAWWYMGRKRR